MNRLSLILCLALLGACSRRPAPAPRPQAWPRIKVYPEAYTEVNGLMVNDSALVEPGTAEGWFDIVYPAYDARINCTLTHAESSLQLQSIIDNRLERLERNIGGTPGELIELTSEEGMGCLVMVAPGALATPVQFLATDSTRCVLSGSAVFASPGLTPDSVAPAVEAVRRDVIYMMKHLKCL